MIQSRAVLGIALSLALVAPRAASAQSLNQLAIQRMNADAQALWTADGIPMLRAQAMEALGKLVGVAHPVNDKTTATITKIKSLTTDCGYAPALTKLDSAGIAARIPSQGSWRFEVVADVHVKGKILGIKIDRTYEVRFELNDLQSFLRMDIDSSNPAAPKIQAFHPIALSFTLKVRTSSWVMNFLLWLTQGTVNEVANVASFAGGAYLSSFLNVNIGGTPQAMFTGGPALQPVAAADLEGAGLKLEDQIFDEKTPYGSVFEMRYDAPYHGTWEQSLRDPNVNLGRPNGIQSYGDSALTTGQVLSGVAFRARAMGGERGAVIRARRLVESMRTMLKMRSEALNDPSQVGNLNRSICPLSAKPDGVTLPHKPGENYAMKWNGVDHIFSDYMSRDAYTGVLLGCSVAHDFLPPSIRDESREPIEWAFDYLYRNHWTWRRRDGQPGELWHGNPNQQYAWVLAAHRVNPAKYAAVREQYKGYADVAWLVPWLECFDPVYSHYKFNLTTVAAYTTCRYETDPVRFQRLYQQIAILRNYLGHFLNAYFNGFYLAIDPSSRARLGAENRNLLARFLRQPRRWIRPDIRNDIPADQKTMYKLPIDPTIPGTTVQQQPPLEISKYPLPPDKRITVGFMWTTSPVKLHNPNWGVDPYVEGESYDFTQPYWMARAYGAIRPPRIVLAAARPLRAAGAVERR